MHNKNEDITTIFLNSQNVYYYYEIRLFPNLIKIAV